LAHIGVGAKASQEQHMRVDTFTLQNLGVDLAFELGWDFAHYGVTPVDSALLGWPQLAQGFDAGRQTFGLRTLQPTRHARKWLQLRLNALGRGRVFDTEQVTPRFLQLIDTPHCPVTRETLSHGTGEPSDWSVDRVFNNAAYAAGNLAVVSARANAAKADHGFNDALHFMKDCEGGVSEVDGLNGAQWARIAVLASFVEKLDHAQAATLPMLVMPPNRLRVFNPVQALQAVLCRLVMALTEAECDGRARAITDELEVRLESLRAHFPGKALRKDVASFTEAYRAQVKALHLAQVHQPMRWAVEDAWQSRLVLNRWKRVARQLTAMQAEMIVAAQGPGTRSLSDQQATEGWALETRGFVVPQPVPRRLADPKVALPPAYWLAAQQVPLFVDQG